MTAFESRLSLVWGRIHNRESPNERGFSRLSFGNGHRVPIVAPKIVQLAAFHVAVTAGYVDRARERAGKGYFEGGRDRFGAVPGNQDPPHHLSRGAIFLTSIKIDVS